MTCDVDSIVPLLAELVARRHSTELQMTGAKWFVFFLQVGLTCSGRIDSTRTPSHTHNIILQTFSRSTSVRWLPPPIFLFHLLWTNQLPVISTITTRRLHLFGHIACADLSQDHSRDLWAAINYPQPSGIVDLGGLGLWQSNWTSSSATLASILRGNVH